MGKQRLSEATSDAAFPHTDDVWEPSTSDLKSYRHFDALMTPKQIETLVRDPALVAAHSFRPLLHFEKRWRRAPKNGATPKPKVRHIHFACRKDAYIYKQYRSILSRLYEKILKEEGLHNTVLAYRRIPVGAGSNICKSNIHFAKDAFDTIIAMGECCAIAIDISDFFGSINHARLKEVWLRLLGESRLPADHFAVFKSITDYKYADFNEVLVALGFSERSADGRLQYLRDPKDIPVQLSTPREYREKVVKANLVHKHRKSYGIPQGTPISDLLANAYLLDFDVSMKTYVDSFNGAYFRYSDDILIILPGNESVADDAFAKAKNEIEKCGNEISLNKNKTDIVCYTPQSPIQRCYGVAFGDDGNLSRISKNMGLSYLGFRFDGRKVFLRDSTITNLRGKIVRRCKAEAFYYVRRHIQKELFWLLQNAPLDSLKQQYLDIENFEEVVNKARLGGMSPFSAMTFWSYAKRAKRLFGAQGRPIDRQLRNIEKLMSEISLRKSAPNFLCCI